MDKYELARQIAESITSNPDGWHCQGNTKIQTLGEVGASDDVHVDVRTSMDRHPDAVRKYKAYIDIGHVDESEVCLEGDDAKVVYEAVKLFFNRPGKDSTLEVLCDRIGALLPVAVA